MTSQAPKYKTETAVFGAGCFWGVEASFMDLKGVVKTEVGYMGGHTENPTYQEVCTDKTGHTEVVKITYNPEIITYRQLLTRFFECHDPTQVNRQGPDIGIQYRSVIFYYNTEQKNLAEEMISALNQSEKFKEPIATSVEPASTFWIAEDYHQQFYKKKGINKSCSY